MPPAAVLRTVQVGLRSRQDQLSIAASSVLSVYPSIFLFFRFASSSAIAASLRATCDAYLTKLKSTFWGFCSICYITMFDSGSILLVSPSDAAQSAACYARSIVADLKSEGGQEMCTLTASV